MKLIVRISFVVIIFLAIVSSSSCSKKSYPANTGRSKRHVVATASPVSPKKEPVRKHYIIPNKRKRILGTDYH